MLKVLCSSLALNAVCIPYCGNKTFSMTITILYRTTFMVPTMWLILAMFRSSYVCTLNHNISQRYLINTLNPVLQFWDTKLKQENIFTYYILGWVKLGLQRNAVRSCHQFSASSPLIWESWTWVTTTCRIQGWSFSLRDWRVHTVHWKFSGQDSSFNHSMMPI